VPWEPTRGAATGSSDRTHTSAERMPRRNSRGSTLSRSAIRQNPPGMTVQPEAVRAAKTRITKGRGTR